MTPPSDVVPQASVRDTVAVGADVLLPLVARGLLARRPRVTGLADRVDADRRALGRMRALQARYGAGPLRLRVPGRTVALVLSAGDVHRVLAESPEPFATGNLEKRSGLAHFQPHGVLISSPAQRAQRRPFNAAVLDEGRPLHRIAEPIVARVHDEAAALLDHVRRTGRLNWDDLISAWWRAVRRVLFGDAARDDHALTDMLTRLRHDANWGYLKPRDDRLRERFLRRLRWHVDRAEPGTLGHLVATTPASDATDRYQQVPQWLFAFDPTGMAAARTLALLATHPAARDRVCDEIAGRDLSVPQDLPYLRACVLESLRLWPTTPAILRGTTATTAWDTGTLPAGATVLIYAPLFHRDPALAYAERFAPDVWLRERGTDDWPLVPFSGGPGMCPGRNLVLLTTGVLLAVLVDGFRLRLDVPAGLTAQRPLPATLSPYRLRFTI